MNLTWRMGGSSRIPQRRGSGWARPLPVRAGSRSLALPAPRPWPRRSQAPGPGRGPRGLPGTHWHSGQARRPSLARPRRQPAQKWWKQSSRQGRSYCAWHSGHTSGWPLAASRAPGPSRGAKIAPDICEDSAGRRQGVRRAQSWERQGPRAGFGAPGGEACGGAGLVLCPHLSRIRTVALKGQAAGPNRASYSVAPPASTSPTNPHSHPRNSPLCVLWVTRRRHPFRAGAPRRPGEAL